MKQIFFIKIGTGFYAVEVDQVKRFVENAEVVDLGVKEKNSGISGMLRFYDKVIPVLDPYKWFGQKQSGSDAKKVFVIMVSKDRSFAFQIGDSIKSAEVPDECFQEIAAFNGRANTNLFNEVIGWEGKLYLKINAESVLKDMTRNNELSELCEKM